MPHRHLARKTRRNPFDGLGRQSDFRDQHNGPLSGLQGHSHALQVDFGFTGTGHAVEQNWLRTILASLPGSKYFFPDSLLILAESRWGIEGKAPTGQRVTPAASLVHTN